MRFYDKSVIAGVTVRESDGTLLVDARVARTGIQMYRGSEVDPDNEHGMRDRAFVSVYRPGSEVFSVDTMKSLAHKYVTNDHPPVMVDVTNAKKYSVGHTADEIVGENIYLRVPLMVTDAETIGLIEDGKRELSSGYWSTLDWTAGKTAKGESYDAVQRNIRFNHVAIVQQGRAGKEVRIGDEAVWGDSPDGNVEGERHMATTRIVVVDGIGIEFTDQGAQAIEKLQRLIDTMTATSAQVLKDHATALATRDGVIATKDAEIEKLKPQILDAAAIDKLVQARANLVGRATKIYKDVKTAGVSDADIRREVVLHKLGDSAKDKPQAYIDVRFDILAEDAGVTDTVREVVRDGVKKDEGTATLYEKMQDDMLAGKATIQ